MEEIVWIRPADYDPAVIAGLVFQPEPDLPAFEVMDRCRVVMMFKAGSAWEIRPFTQLTLKIVEEPAL
ncbi:hypothetical protein [Methylobacterium sp. E-045]|jgi:hypothetical protein|uniref:hypothetical protein n=1 Tax=Methylobacterium sp. E-045 TaxID=2836575 RepID=UPI001FB8ADEB|nr:hypothetical protein [Methylobacterium sp. E-045]MCJ2131060.1 hypothetical protein [Methylobacterium sp. E-045]